MFSTITLMTIIYFIVSVIYFQLAAHLLYEDKNSVVNRIFSLSMLALSVWSACLAIVSTTPSIEIAMQFKRISAFAWSFFFALFLNSVILLTDKKSIIESMFVKHLLYLPAIITCYAFSISNTTTKIVYQLTPIWYGWKNNAPNTIWLHIFNFYFISYLFFSLLLLLQWKNRTIFAAQKKVAKIIVASYGLAFIIGTITDIILPRFTGVVAPDTACILAIMPTAAIFYAIKKFKLTTITHTNLANDILRNINECFFLLDLNGIIKKTNDSTMKLLGYEQKELLNNDISVVFKNKNEINYSVWSFLDSDGNLKTLDSLNFPKDRETIAITKDGKYVNVMLSASPVIDKWDNLLGVACVLSDLTTIKKGQEELEKAHIELEKKVEQRTIELSKLNSILTDEMKNKQKQVEIQTMISEVSSDFITINNNNISEKINTMLKGVGVAFELDLVLIFTFGFDVTIDPITCKYEWFSTESESILGSGTSSLSADFPWWSNVMREYGIVKFSDIADFPDEAEPERESLQSIGVKSTMNIAVSNRDRVFGFISFNTTKEHRVWTDSDVTILNLVSNILADGFAKVDAEKEIKFLAYNDHLTALPNRVTMMKYVNSKIAENKNRDYVLSVIFIDLDSFKIINDSMGREGGDRLIKIVAQKLSKVLDGNVFISRIGGDEFAFVLENITKVDVILNQVQKTLKTFDTSFQIGEQDFFVTASIGISMYPFDGDDADMLIRNANLAVNKAKEKGKNRFEFCSEQIKKDIDKKTYLINSLHHALEKNELVLYYQPQVETESGEIIGVEALIRWKHSEYGMISPGVFIPLAEQNGLINTIGKWILETACEQNKKWQDMGLKKIVMAVNLSVQQFKNPDLYKDIKEAMVKADLEPQYLELEITESVAMTEKDSIVKILTRMKGLGVDIAIDDFGTDFSSLSRIRDLPIDKIKIAMEFVRGLEENEKDRAIAMVIIMLARNLDLKLIAEGVETEYQLDYLKDRMCDQIQGYYFYKPMPADEVEKLLRDGK